MINDVLNIALGVMIAQAMRPLILSAIHIADMKIRGNYWRAPDTGLVADWLRNAKGLY